MKSTWKTLIMVAACMLITGLVVSCEDGGGSAGGPSADANPFAGSYSGTFSGDDSGTWTIRVANDGNVTGSAQSTIYGDSYAVFGELSNDGELAATVGGGTSDGATWTGQITSEGAVSGTWQNLFWNDSGTFAGNRD